MEKYIENIDERSAIDLSKILKMVDIKNEIEFKLKFSDTVTCTPFGMLLMSNLIKRFRNKNETVQFKVRINKESSSIKYAGHMGFFKAISEDVIFGKMPGEATGSNNYVPITKIHFRDYRKKAFFSYMEPLRYIEYEATNLARVIAQGNKELEGLFVYLIREIIRNSEEHGYVDEAWICAQNWKNKNIAEIAILDNGRGYQNSLKAKYGKLVTNDETSMRIALKPGITEANINKYAQEEINSGFGLYVASEICSELNGIFSILSGDTVIRKNNGAISINKAFHEGSIIKMSIDTSRKFICKDLITQIVSRGEAEKKNLKASELSKGKFLLYS